jgi:hypothetical protein
MLNLTSNYEKLQQERQERQDAFMDKIRADASKALRAGNAYAWEWYEDKHFQVQPALKNVVEFMQAHETGEFTMHNLMLEILEKCDGKGSKNASSIAIDYMSHLIAELELEGWE